LKFLILTAVSFVVIASMVGCKKTTNNTTEVKDSIYYSPWTPLTMTFDATDSVYYELFTNSKITASIVSSGAVLTYYGFPASTGDTVVLDQATMVYYSGVQLTFATDSLEIETPYPEDLTYSNSGGYLFRYVIIPANVLSSSAYKDLSRDQLNHLSFTDVSKALNVPVSGNKAGTQPRF
jgi:ABC-type Zn uptake system ZnuABC Zn-binding protein ZnuA